MQHRQTRYRKLTKALPESHHSATKHKVLTYTRDGVRACCCGSHRFIDAGRIVEIAPPEEFFRRPEVGSRTPFSRPVDVLADRKSTGR